MSVIMKYIYPLIQVKDAVNFQTRIKLGDSIPIQWIPLKAVGARPPNFKDVKIEGDSGTGTPPQQKTFLQRYVRTHHSKKIKHIIHLVLLTFFLQWYIALFMVIYLFIGRMNPPAEQPSSAPAATTTASKKKD